MLSHNEKKKFFTKLIDSTYESLLLYARMKVSDASKAYDLVQDTCCTAWENIDTLMCSENPGGWLMNTLKNHIHKFYDTLGKEKRIVDALTVDMKEDTYTHDLENEIEFMSILSKDEIKVVELKEQGYKHYEIAQIMEVKLGTIDSKVSRIKNKIIKFLRNKKNN